MRPGSSSPALRAFFAISLALVPLSGWAEERLTLVGLAKPPQPAAIARLLPNDPQTALPPRFGHPALPVRAVIPDDIAGPGPVQSVGPLGLPCEARLTATLSQGGTVHLRLEAPCHPSERVTLRHGKLQADYFTSSSGIIETVFPALSEIARYRADLRGGQFVQTAAHVPGAETYERVVTMWHGHTGLAIHAFEYGARQGQAGHIWRGDPRAPTIAEAGRGGFLLELGAAHPGARRAEVYSFPAGDAARGGAVRISLGVQVNTATCGQKIEAVTLQLGRDLPGEPVDVSVTMPDCSQAGGYLLLKNLARDLKIAAQ